jgi:hypothetical protein
LAEKFDPEASRKCSFVRLNGVKCQAWAIRGGTVCRQHGGQLPQVSAKAAARMAESQQRRRALERVQRSGFTVSGVEDAIGILEERMAVQTEMARALDDLVRRLVELDELRYEHGKAGEQLRGELQIWLQMQTLLGKTAADYLKLNVAERKQRLAESQALMVVQVIKAILGRLELSREQKALAVTVVPEELRAIE